MKKNVYAILLLFTFLLILSGCGQDEDRTPVTGERKEEISSFVNNFKQEMLIALNEDDFNRLEPFLIVNNHFYHSVRRYLSDAQSKATNAKLHDFIVESVEVNDYDEYFVNIYEKMEVTERQLEPQIEESKHTYVIVEIKNQLKLVEIQVRRE
ncbi:TcaA NTF2-like domain-containing protein [Bacillus sp. FJAT-45350]|uniref:TcaA NTF2-like domain-containing protein n=1 Tax=Bacillus sp. FJAT-45350 TaxID=2011014 RepID=UPI000BB706AA|nr:hypothetical protein [Bacillus sp. FJAT-45350]